MAITRNRLSILLAEKAFKEDRRITLEEVARESGVALSTVKAYVRQSDPVTRFDAAVIAKLCAYFGCEIGDLLVIVGDESPEKKSLHYPARELQPAV